MYTIFHAPLGAPKLVKAKAHEGLLRKHKTLRIQRIEREGQANERLRHFHA
jgi:hypothetical protein